MDEMVLNQMGIITGWVLLPLLPAVLIYWLFPKTPLNLSGPFHGMTLNTGGAFGAYLVIFLLLMPKVGDVFATANRGIHQAWIIRGEFKPVTRNGEPWSPGRDFFSKIAMRTEPTISSFSERFTIHIPEVEADIPTIYLDIGKDYTVPITVKKTSSRNNVIMMDPILITQQQMRDESADNKPVLPK